jgi:hypothetical protein
MKPPRKPGKRHPNPVNGICVVRGCGETYEGKAKKALHRCAHHRAELKGFQKLVKDKTLLAMIVTRQRHGTLKIEAE